MTPILQNTCILGQKSSLSLHGHPAIWTDGCECGQPGVIHVHVFSVDTWNNINNGNCPNVTSPRVPKSSFVCECVFRESTSMKSDQQRVTTMTTCIKPDPSVSLIPTNTPLAMRNSKKTSPGGRTFIFNCWSWLCLQWGRCWSTPVLSSVQERVKTLTFLYDSGKQEFRGMQRLLLTS